MTEELRWTIILGLFTTSIFPFPNHKDLDQGEEIMSEVCNDDYEDDLDWDVIHEKALEKLTEIQRFTERKDVMEHLVKELVVNHNRVKRHGYHDDHDYDDDHNVVVRCKHGYTGEKLLETTIFILNYNNQDCSPSWLFPY